MTGNDDSNLKKTEKKEIWSAKKNANIELLQQLLDDEIENLNLLNSQKDVFSDIEFDNMNSSKIKDIQNEIADLNNKLDQAAKLKHKLQSDITYNKNLKYKFSLLNEQYLSDIERLQFIDEGSFLFNQLYAFKCPHCGEQITESDLHNHPDANVGDINAACSFEIEKIQNNLKELQKSKVTVDNILAESHEKLLKVQNQSGILES